jgi:hypothetical protein
MTDVISITIYFKSGRNASYQTIKNDKLFSVIITDFKITLKWMSGSCAIFLMDTVAGYYINRKK